MINNFKLGKQSRSNKAHRTTVFMLFFIALSFSMLATTLNSSTDDLELWYKTSASKSADAKWNENDIWQQATLPIGNGDMGANVYGEVVKERLSFNEKTLWTGGPALSRPDFTGGNLVEKGKNGETMKTIQTLFSNGKDAEAGKLCGDLIGKIDGYGAYQAWGDICFLNNNINENVDNYTRDLNLKTAIVSVSFQQNSTKFTREYFISNPDNVLIARFEAFGNEKLDIDISFSSKQEGVTFTCVNDLYMTGQVPDNQLRYFSRLRVVNDGGAVIADGAVLKVKNAKAFTVFMSAATDYKQEYPSYRTGETAEALVDRVTSTVDAAEKKGYEVVKKAHIEDYSNLFNRVDLNFGNAVSSKSTDELLAAYKNKTATSEEQRKLEVLLFQYGRYLILGSSRKNSQLPANLQGVWNNKNNPAWASDYHMNVNLQMNYWPVYSTNLAECAIPLIDYVEALRIPGRITAEIYAGVKSKAGEENGFMAHTQNTPFGWTCPGWKFDWGWSPAAVPWILQNCWEYYEYTGDLEYMKKAIYPMMKEAAMLYDQMLVRDKDGKLISSPSFSPEHGPRTAGNTYEQSLIWQLYQDVISAAKLVGEDKTLITKWQNNQKDLKCPIEIGTDGQIKEWYHETTLQSVDKNQYSHRHISQMLGLHPGDLLTQKNTAWFEAAKVSMKNRTDESTGWGMGQRINIWARLQDGNKAHKLITDLFAKGIYRNLWDTHPPFQIDGNFGYTAGVSEMLLQSNAGYISILPALPDVWKNGNVKGLMARGNFEIGIDWEKSKVNKLTILSNKGNDAIIEMNNISRSKLKTTNGNLVKFKRISNDRISFKTEAGQTYIASLNN